MGNPAPKKTPRKLPRRVEVWRSEKDRLWYFHLRSSNGTVMCTSDGYIRRHSAVAAAQTTFDPDWPVSLRVLEVNGTLTESDHIL